MKNKLPFCYFYSKKAVVFLSSFLAVLVYTGVNVLVLPANAKILYPKSQTTFAAFLPTVLPTSTKSPTPTLIPTQIVTPTQALITKTTIIPVTTNNSLPVGGYARQTVHTSSGSFTVDIISADLSTTKVIVDTASDSDCLNNCPVLPLSEFVSRSGAYAGINGTYFCPTSYSGCAGKTNSFDTLLMNKNKTYFNVSNNVNSIVPIVAFSTTAQFIAHTSDFNRSTDVDSVIAMQPLLVLGGQVVFFGDGDPKKDSIGLRNFIASQGTNVYIGSIHSVTMVQAAQVLQAMGVNNALNLDEGGSSALMYNDQYIQGPGRDIPNAVLFIRR